MITKVSHWQILVGLGEKTRESLHAHDISAAALFESWSACNVKHQWYFLLEPSVDVGH